MKIYYRSWTCTLVLSRILEDFCEDFCVGISGTATPIIGCHFVIPSGSCTYICISSLECVVIKRSECLPFWMQCLTCLFTIRRMVKLHVCICLLTECKWYMLLLSGKGYTLEKQGRCCQNFPKTSEYKHGVGNYFLA